MSEVRSIPKCRNCRHSRPSMHDGLVSCHRMPPAVHSVLRANPLTQQTEQAFVAIFPEVPEKELCGEWCSDPVSHEFLLNRGGEQS